MLAIRISASRIHRVICSGPAPLLKVFKSSEILAPQRSFQRAISPNISIGFESLLWPQAVHSTTAEAPENKMGLFVVSFMLSHLLSLREYHRA